MSLVQTKHNHFVYAQIEFEADWYFMMRNLGKFPQRNICRILSDADFAVYKAGDDKCIRV